MPQHVVKSGETLGGIAARFGMTWRELASANAMRDADFIRIGQTLNIPERGAKTSSKPRIKPADPPRDHAPPIRPVPGREGTTRMFLSKLMAFWGSTGQGRLRSGQTGGRRAQGGHELP